MIWFRRLLTIPLILVFIVLFIVVLFTSQIKGTVGNPEFYTDQLRQADMYNFVYDEALPAALDEIDTDDSSDNPIDITAIKDEVVSAVRKTLPPEWLQAQVEAAINTIIPYALGSTDDFTYTVMLKDRVERAAQVIKDDILRGDSATKLYDDAMSYAAEKVAENQDELPFSLSLSEQQIENSLRTAVTEDWIISQATAAIDSVMPYLTNDSDHFTITLQPRSLVDPLAMAVIDLFGEQETYDYLLHETITTFVALYLGLAVDLPFEVKLSQEEIDSAIKEMLPLSWVQARLEEIVRGIAAYVKGEADDITVDINLGDRKAAALNALTELADRKLRERFDNLRVCSLAEFVQAVQGLPSGNLPDCRPSGVSYEDFKTAMNLDIAVWVERLVGDKIPDQWVYTYADLKKSLGEENVDFLDDVRDWVSEGWTFTDADLTDELDSDDRETLEDIRGWIGNGYTVTEADLRDWMEDGDIDPDDIDTARNWLGTATTWSWALWLLPVLFLLSIGLLGGRNWRSKLLWALVLLFVISLVSYIGAGPVYSNVGEPRIERITSDWEGHEGIEGVMSKKGTEVIVNVTSTFASGIQSKTLYMMIGSGVLLVGVIAWSVARSGRRPTPREEEPPQQPV